MAAVIAPDPVAPWNRPEHGPERRARLRVIEGGRRELPARPAPATAPHRPRAGRVVLALGALVVAAAAALGALRVVGAGSAAPLPATTTGAHLAGADASTTSAPVEVVVQPGDSLWTIARSLQPRGDVRPLVDRLVERAGGVTVVPGQRLDVSGLVD